MYMVMCMHVYGYVCCTMLVECGIYYDGGMWNVGCHLPSRPRCQVPQIDWPYCKRCVVIQSTCQIQVCYFLRVKFISLDG